ncbi:helix-turn-helix transcriptional regulator [Marinobacter metalliresistant]|uniref:Helix-turn-helix transcriptional regulator n=1 Tax=Marinobacter metalliresistant TaxID=2961995 RepID=A0ABZ2W5N3_9GAMM
MQTDPESASHPRTQSRKATRDIVDTLRTAGVAPQRMLELDQGRALAQWQNHQGEVRYERPRHHALSIYIDKGEQARRVLNGKVVSRHSDLPQTLPEVTGTLSLRYRRLLQERINAQLSQPLTLADMASWVNLSPYHFARLFRATFDCAPYQYVQEQRLIRARDMLRKRSDNITAIALTCGFNDSSQFSRAFKSRFGITPSGYRAEAHLNH